MNLQDRIAKLVGRPAFWIVFFAIAFGFHLVRAMMSPKPQPIPEAVGVLDLFRLTDHHGRAFGTQKVAGSVWVASVFCTRCPSVNPALMKTLHDVQHRSRNLGHRFLIVSVSVDPEHDTVEHLQEYAELQKASTRRWVFLTGARGPLRKMIDGLYAADPIQSPVDPDSEAIHPSAPHRFVLLDQVTQIRGYYDARDEADIDRMLNDAALLLNFAHRPAPRPEAPESTD